MGLLSVHITVQLKEVKISEASYGIFLFYLYFVLFYFVNNFYNRNTFIKNFCFLFLENLNKKMCGIRKKVMRESSESK